MTISEKSAYLKGLMDGLKLSTETDEGKMIAAIVDLLGDLSRKVTDIEDTTIAISDELDEIEEDLDAIEDFIMDCEDDEEYDDEDEYEECDGDCEACDGCDCADEDYYEIVCPSCGETVCFDQELDPENLLCPACGEKFGCIVDEDDYKAISEDNE